MKDHKGTKANGRPSKFTPENRKRILAAVRMGVPVSLAPLSAGVAYHTMRAWLIQGEKATSGEYHDFFIAMKKAEGQAVEGRFREIKAAAKKDWRAAYALLRLRYPKLFGNLAAKQEVTERLTYEDAIRQIRVQRERTISVERAHEDEIEKLEDLDAGEEDESDDLPGIEGGNSNGNGHS